MKQTIPNQAGNKAAIPSWNARYSDIRSATELIEAWDKGIAHGKTDADRLLRATFLTSIGKAADLTNILIDQLKVREIAVCDAYIRIESSSDFCVLCLIDEKQYNEENTEECYSLCCDLEEKNNDEAFEISFSFYPKSADTKEENIWSDGFNLKYVNRRKTASA